jgi:hypothetical protein
MKTKLSIFLAMMFLSAASHAVVGTLSSRLALSIQKGLLGKSTVARLSSTNKIDMSYRLKRGTVSIKDSMGIKASSSNLTISTGNVGINHHLEVVLHDSLPKLIKNKTIAVTFLSKTYNKTTQISSAEVRKMLQAAFGDIPAKGVYQISKTKSGYIPTMDGFDFQVILSKSSTYEKNVAEFLNLLSKKLRKMDRIIHDRVESLNI